MTPTPRAGTSGSCPREPGDRCRHEEPAIISKILAHLERLALEQHWPERPLGGRRLRCNLACFEFEVSESSWLTRRDGAEYARLHLGRRGIRQFQRRGGDLQLRRDSWSQEGG